MPIPGLLQDLRFSIRHLRKSPGFTLTATLTLALGIGATTAIFTLVHAVMLKSLPVTEPEQLWRIGKKVHCCDWGGCTQWEEFSLFNNELYHRFKDNTPEFEELAAFQAGSTGLGVRRAGSGQAAEPRTGQFVSGNFFSTFGVAPWIGRVIRSSDDREGAPPVAVLSYHAWKDKFDADPSVVGSAWLFNNNPFMIVGVAAPGFAGANLLLARGLRSRHQTSLRVALGAARARLMRKALVESLVLGLAALAVAALPARRAVSVNLTEALRTE